MCRRWNVDEEEIFHVTKHRVDTRFTSLFHFIWWSINNLFYNWRYEMLYEKWKFKFFVLLLAAICSIFDKNHQRWEVALIPFQIQINSAHIYNFRELHVHVPECLMSQLIIGLFLCSKINYLLSLVSKESSSAGSNTNWSVEKWKADDVTRGRRIRWNLKLN